MKFFFFLISFFCVFSLFGQDFYLPEKSELISEGTYKRYTEILKKEFSSGDKIKYENIAASYAQLKVDSSIVFSYLLKALEKDSTIACDYIYSMGIVLDIKLYKELNSSAWDNLCDICSLYKIKHKKAEPQPLSDLEKRLHEIDKRYIEYRMVMIFKERENELDSVKFYWKKQQFNDSVNFVVLKSIFNEYGYPGKSQVQEAYKDVGCLVMQHAPFAMKKQYVKIIHDAAVAGEFNRGSYLHLIDHMHYDKFGTQLYHTQRFKDKGETEYRSMDMENE